MIADAVGVTKAAIYHQFGTKDAIVLARPRSAAPAARVCRSTRQSARAQRCRHERPSSRACSRSSSPTGGALSTLQRDPVLFRLIEEDEPARDLFTRLFTVLLGDDVRHRARVRAAVLSAAIGAVAHPFVADLDNDTLRDDLLDVIRKLTFEPG